VPGLVGIVARDGTPVDAARFDAARRRMLRHGRMVSDDVTALDGTVRMAHVRLANGCTTAWDGGARPTAVFHGVLYNEAVLRRSLGVGIPTEPVGALITAMYEREGVGFVERLEGEYCVALIDPIRRALVLCTDPIGNYPLYWHTAPDGLVFGSNLAALLKARPELNKLDLPAVADYLTIGAVLEEKTLVRGIHALDPGTVLTYDLNHGDISFNRYLDIANFFDDGPRDKGTYLRAVEEAFERAVGHALNDTRPVGLSLSGGLDSRAILAAANGRARQLRTFTLGVAGCADEVIAEQLARIAGTAHRYFELDDRYLRDFLPNMAEMVSATDGQYLSHGLTEMLALRFVEETGVGVLLRGHGGELAKAHLAWPLQTDEKAYAAASVDDFLPDLSARANYITRGLALHRLLTPAAAREAGQGALASFRRVLDGTRLSPAQACSYLYLRELHRRFTVPSLELFRTRVDVRLPFVEVAFLRTLLAGPSRWRDSTEIHQRITGNLPALLTVRNSNTGAPANAGPTAERVFDKVNSALKRLNIRGYRHYHNFDEWMRRTLFESVEAELLGPSARVRGLVTDRTVRALIEETRTGAVDRSYLLQVLLILELWMRENQMEVAA
jgi:asparagine synthase (glutamine-hydrolysing)